MYRHLVKLFIAITEFTTPLDLCDPLLHCFISTFYISFRALLVTALH